MRLKYALGLCLVPLLLAGCSLPHSSYKNYLAEKERSLTGLSESVLPDNPYADKVDKEGKSQEKELQKFKLSPKKEKEILERSDYHLAKLAVRPSEEKAKKEKINPLTNPTAALAEGLVAPVNSTSIAYMGTIEDAVKETKERMRKLWDTPNMKVNVGDKKEKPLSLHQMVDELNAQRATYGEGPVDKPFYLD